MSLLLLLQLWHKLNLTLLILVNCMFFKLYLLPISMATYAYFWKLISYKIYFTCFKFCSIASLLGLSFPPLRSFSSYVILVPDGPAASLFLLFSSSYEVSGFKDRTKIFKWWHNLCPYVHAFGQLAYVPHSWLDMHWYYPH